MKKILVVDDDAVVRSIIVKMLEKNGYMAIQSLNGRHALDTLQVNGDISLVITDAMMPEMSGHELLKVLRGHSNYKHLPVIMISAVISVNEIANLIDLGAACFLPKPLDFKALTEMIVQAEQLTGGDANLSTMDSDS